MLGDRKRLERLVMLRAESSMLSWLPKVSSLPIPQPRTVVVVLSEEEREALMEGAMLSGLIRRLRRAAAEIGYPLFLRTDHLSGKHLWGRTCYVADGEALIRNALFLADYSMSVDILGLPVNAFVLREYVELDSAFRAFAGMPIARERRYLVNNGEVVAHFPYWPKEAIEFWRGVEPPSDWEKKLEELNCETEEEVELLTGYAEKIGSALSGFWSLDFAKAKNGTWYFIDAARGEISWMPRSIAEKLKAMGLEVFG